MERQIEVFFYGLFMDEDVLREHGFRPAGARQARVDGLCCGSALVRRWCLIPVNPCTGC
jgi:hypothetical protein